MTQTVEQRRICWPDFDCTCLEGGCGYCNSHPFRNVSAIEKAIEGDMGTPFNRGNGSTGDLRRSFEWGRSHNWSNADSRVYEVSER